MAKTMIKNVCHYIRSKNDNWFSKKWIKKRTIQVISCLLKVLMLFGIIILISEPMTEDTKTFMMTLIMKTNVSAIVIYASHVLSEKIDGAF